MREKYHLATVGQIFLWPSRCVQIQGSTPPQSSPYKGEEGMDCYLIDHLMDDLTPEDPHETLKSCFESCRRLFVTSSS